MSLKGITRWLWIPMVMVFFVPVMVTLSSHSAILEPSSQGELIIGRAGLDSLLEGSAGTPVIVNFWATWCTPCVAELPVIDRVYSESEGAIMAVAVDIGDPDMETLLDFREDFTVSMPVVWLDPAEVDILKAEWELADVLPLTVFIGPSGTETSRAYGARSGEFFQTAAETGETLPDTAASIEDHGSGSLHINVAGDPADPLTAELLAASVELAGDDGVDLFDPADPGDVRLMDSLYLPSSGFPYAQPCVGTACGRPAGSVEELLQGVDALLR